MKYDGAPAVCSHLQPQVLEPLAERGRDGGAGPAQHLGALLAGPQEPRVVDHVQGSSGHGHLGGPPATTPPPPPQQHKLYL